MPKSHHYSCSVNGFIESHHNHSQATEKSQSEESLRALNGIQKYINVEVYDSCLDNVPEVPPLRYRQIAEIGTADSTE